MPIPLKKHWVIADPIPTDVDTLLSDYPPFLRQILFNRGVSDAASARRFLDCQEQSWDPFLMQDMDIAVDRLLWAIDQSEPIAVYGDYDVDGVTATVLMVQVLRAMGANVREYIPSRFDEGYGLNKDALQSLASEGVRVVITVDCGIRSPNEALFARSLGLDLIISDHHHPHDELPGACAVICPRRPGNLYPEVNLSGVGLAYKVAQALLLRRPVAHVRADDWLDLVALGTVADIVPLIGENRVLVRAGLERMRWAHRQGLVSLASVAGVTINRISASDIGFMLGPRLNAAGRLDSALAAFNLLITQDMMQSGMLTQRLDDQNRERQKLTQVLQAEADLQIQEQGVPLLIFSLHRSENPAVSGVVGLVAAKLAETYYRPTAVVHVGPEFSRASCRSIPEFHITQALDECSDLLERHGGHAAAAGFTVRNEILPVLMERLRAIAERDLGALHLRPVVRADLEIDLSSLHPDFLPWLDKLQPTGMGNPDALFVARNVRVVRGKLVGNEGQHLRLTVTDKNNVYWDAIAFRQGRWYAELPRQVDLLFNYERNHYNGLTQLNVRDLRPSGASE